MGCYERLPYRVKNLDTNEWYVLIQDAIYDANDGDTLEAVEYVYEEAIDFDGRAITLTSTDPCDPCVVAATVIDAGGSGDAVTFKSGEDANSILTGFTVTGADDTGVYCGFTSPTITRCVIEQNCQGIRGFGDPLIANNIIRDNSSFGIQLVPSNSTIENNLIYDNDIGISRGPGCTITVTNCTIVDNTSIGISGSSWMTITNCILWNNGDDLSGGSATYSCISDPCDIGDPNITHNINSDPCFVDADANDFHLTAVSPCINAGNNDVVDDGETDIDGDLRVIATRVDMGADETTYTVHNTTQDVWYTTIQGAIDEANNYDEIVV